MFKKEGKIDLNFYEKINGSKYLMILTKLDRINLFFTVNSIFKLVRRIYKVNLYILHILGASMVRFRYILNRITKLFGYLNLVTNWFHLSMVQLIG